MLNIQTEVAEATKAIETMKEHMDDYENIKKAGTDTTQT